MTTLLVLLLALIGAGFALRARAESERRRRAEDELELHRRSADSFAAHVAPLITHELRSHIATVLGYQELLADGLLGDMPPEALEALGRIHRAGRQILALTDGTGKLLAPRQEQPRLEHLDLVTVLRDTIDETGPLADSYGIALAFPDTPADATPAWVTAEKDSLRAALELVLGAVIRTSAGSSPAISLDEDPHHVTIAIATAGLDPARDGAAIAEPPPTVAPTTGAGLRLAMAACLLRPAGGRIDLAADPDTGSVSLRLVVPRAAASPELTGG